MASYPPLLPQKLALFPASSSIHSSSPRRLPAPPPHHVLGRLHRGRPADVAGQRHVAHTLRHRGQGAGSRQPGCLRRRPRGGARACGGVRAGGQRGLRRGRHRGVGPAAGRAARAAQGRRRQVGAVPRAARQGRAGRGRRAREGREPARMAQGECVQRDHGRADGAHKRRQPAQAAALGGRPHHVPAGRPGGHLPRRVVRRHQVPARPAEGVPAPHVDVHLGLRGARRVGRGSGRAGGPRGDERALRAGHARRVAAVAARARPALRADAGLRGQGGRGRRGD
eukprot:7391513-Prymnesium_polylepis.3